MQDKWFECGWITVLKKDSSVVGVGTSSRFQLSEKIMNRILEGEELADIMDDLSGMRDVRSNAGAMGLLTNGLINRDVAYLHGIIYAFSPFISDQKYWK